MTSLINFNTNAHPPKLTEWLDAYPRLHTLVAVSKSVPYSEIQRLYQLGYTDFGENRVQDLQAKALENTLPITWHFIGHIQSNKLKQVIQYADWIHSVDSLKLLQLIEQEAIKAHKTPSVLIQLKLTQEDSKYGLLPELLDEVLKLIPTLKQVRVRGFMVMGPHTDHQDEINQVFAQAEHLFKQYKNIHTGFNQLSMGMSQDYELAYAHQATMFRIGSLLFAQRTL